MLALALGDRRLFPLGATTISSVRKRATGREIGRAFVIAIPALILPFLIRAAVVEGVATAAEVSTIGIAYTIVAGLFIYRQFDWRRVWPMLVDTASLSGSILFIVGTATAMAWALTQSGFSRELALAMAKVPGGAAGFMALQHRGVRHPRQRAGRRSGAGAARAAAVPDRASRWASTRCTIRWW